jgi:hypothetical protein
VISMTAIKQDGRFDMYAIFAAPECLKC